MKRFGISHWAIINHLLDGRWHSRTSIEQAVLRRFIDLGRQKPNHVVWRGCATKSLMWMVNNLWVYALNKGLDKDSQFFKIDKKKKKYYLNWKRAYERDIAQGRVGDIGVYIAGNPLSPKTDIIRGKVWVTRIPIEAKNSSIGSLKS